MITNADTGETVDINARIVDRVPVLAAFAEMIRVRIVVGVLMVSDPRGIVKARTGDDVLNCEMEEYIWIL